MAGEMESNLQQKDFITPRLQLVAWELTRSCNLFCAHCRGSASDGQFSGELSTSECFRLIDQILEVASPILILSGGEPLVRDDIVPIASYAASKGLRIVMGTNGTLLTEAMAAKLKTIPVSRVGISLDFPTAELQDRFRGKAGAFKAALAGIANARAAGIDVQINSTITKSNVFLLPALFSLALKVGAVAFHPFMLVPTGRGKVLKSLEVSPEQYEETLNWVFGKQLELEQKMSLKPTCAPHYLRVAKQREKKLRMLGNTQPATNHNAMHSLTRGCLAGTGFAFVSHQGKVKGCGYLDIEAGDIRKESFGQVWNNSSLFQELRNLSNLRGNCGVCEYKRVCGGCRARAYEATGDYFAAEPYCIYKPASCDVSSKI